MKPVQNAIGGQTKSPARVTGRDAAEAGSQGFLPRVWGDVAPQGQLAAASRFQEVTSGNRNAFTRNTTAPGFSPVPQCVPFTHLSISR